MQSNIKTPAREPIAHDPPSDGDHLAAADLLSARVKELLGRAMEEPETLSPGEVRELAASVVFWLAALNGMDPG